jgi:hypothetical protein
MVLGLKGCHIWSLLHLKIFESMHQETATARFDMCRFGLRVPKTNKLLRKRSVLLTTNDKCFMQFMTSVAQTSMITKASKGISA